MMGAEIAALPAPVARETRAFFLKNLFWLETALGISRARAMQIIATLEGAIILARTLGNTTSFDQVSENLSA